MPNLTLSRAGRFLLNRRGFLQSAGGLGSIALLKLLDGFTVWLAGAGVKHGFSHGATDDFGHRAVTPATTIYDLHAMILHLLGLEHERLSFYHNGIERRLTDVHGHVVDEVLA